MKKLITTTLSLMLLAGIIITACTKKADTTTTPAKKCVVNVMKIDGKPFIRSTIDGNNHISKVQFYDNSGIVTSYTAYEYNGSNPSKISDQDPNGKVLNYITLEYSGSNVSKVHIFDYDQSSDKFIETSYCSYSYNGSRITKAEIFQPGSPTALSSIDYTTDGNGNVLTTKDNSTSTTTTYSGYDGKNNPGKGFLYTASAPGVEFFSPNNYGSHPFGSTTTTRTFEYNTDGNPTKITETTNGISIVYTMEYSCK
ncbi:MAG: hypothetical protein NTX03_10870 [Bacteroidetes bacterium]|nr:hypothetical protein [Bacteroidota bacterium]